MLASTTSGKEPLLYTTPLSVVGISFRTVSVTVREHAAPTSHIPEVLKSCLSKASTAEPFEAVLLSTCNRCEFYSTSRRGGEEFIETLKERLGSALPENAFYRFTNRDAVRHLMRVASSLDSMIVGETQILAQVKDSYAYSAKEGHSKKLFHRLFQLAFGVAKKIRDRTSVAEEGISISSIAVKLAENISGDISSSKILIIGSGRMAELFAIHAKARGARHITICNRTLERAESLASLVNGRAVSLDMLDSVIDSADIVIGSLAIDRPIIEFKKVREIAAKKPLFFIDLGVPRNFPQSFSSIENVILYNIDDLEKVSSQHKEMRHDAAQDALVIIEYGIHQFEKWMKRVELEPYILNSREEIALVCKEEVLRFFGEGKHTTEELNEFSARLAAKLSHHLTVTNLTKLSQDEW